MPENNKQAKLMGELISRAWSDETFKTRLLSDTMGVLKEVGAVVPAGMTVKAIENTDKVFHVIIPPKPCDRELSDADLDRAAGGTCDLYGTICDPMPIATMKACSNSDRIAFL